MILALPLGALFSLPLGFPFKEVLRVGLCAL